MRGAPKARGHHARFSSELIIGGDKFATQRQSLDRPLDVVVGTPGRLIKHMEEGNLFMSAVTHVVLDEADTLFEAGFGDEIKRLLRPLKKPHWDGKTKKSAVVVSATMSEKVVKMMREELEELVIIDTPSLHKSAPNLKHRFVDCPGSVDKVAVMGEVDASGCGAGRNASESCEKVAACQEVGYAMKARGGAVGVGGERKRGRER